MAPQLSTLVMVFVAWTVVVSVMQQLQVFRSPRCEKAGLENVEQSTCLHPLFAPAEPVDFYIYATTDEAVEWWTPKGLKELQKSLLWNETSIGFGDTVDQRLVSVPLSTDHLQSVGRNESMLHAHCFLVRNGKALEEALLAAGHKSAPDTGPAVDVLGTDVLHAKATITKLLPAVTRRKRFRLLSNTSGSNKSTNDTADEEIPVYSRVPFLGEVPIYPAAALQWLASSFIASGFFKPNSGLAALRHVLVGVFAPWMINLHFEQRALRRELQREEAQAAYLAWKEAPIVPHIVPRIRIELATDAEVYDARYKPPLLYKEMIFSKKQPMPIGERDIRYYVAGGKRGSSKRYASPMTLDVASPTLREWQPLSLDPKQEDIQVPLLVEVTGMIKYSMVMSMRQGLQVYMQFGVQEQDMEDIQGMFFRHPVHIMIIMQVIGFLQMTLTTLAFKNDISFFQGRTNYQGLSSRSLATDTLQEIIIFLYLWDFDNISRIILIQVGVGSVISAWKYVRVAKLSLYWAYFLPWVSPKRGEGDNESELQTEEIDAKGMRYLKFILYPLSAVWGFYNLYYYAYKSWWSWLISSMADFAYTFGFINMMPQIFINYRLKSVAHMPWRVLGYKFFNTFIDDVFAFFIMSEYTTQKHRWMTLRDDVVFFIFLYQRYIYKIDRTRPDEFGYVYADGETTDAALTDNAGSAKDNLPIASEATSDAITEFLKENKLDSRAAAALALRALSPELQEKIVAEGPITGSSPSAMLLARIQKMEVQAAEGGRATEEEEDEEEKKQEPAAAPHQATEEEEEEEEAPGGPTDNTDGS